jgi:dihydroneopterin aldolase
VDKILLEGLEFYAFHGYYSEELKIGSSFIIDLELHTNLKKSGENDRIEDTIDYSSVYKLVKQEMETPSKLIENVGARIINSLFTNFDRLERAVIKISKINPPVGGKIKSASIIIEKSRKE